MRIKASISLERHSVSECNKLQEAIMKTEIFVYSEILIDFTSSNQVLFEDLVGMFIRSFPIL
jgi:hypothetical protein